MTAHNEYFLNRQVQLALYGLKRQYGGAITVVYVLSNTSDARTGEAVVRYRATRVPHAIILPARVSRDVERSISAISANKQLVTGGWFDSSKRTIIIDRRDLGPLTLEKDDFLVYNHGKYAVETIDEYEFSAAYVIVAKRLSGETFDDSALAQCLESSDTLSLESIGSGEV